MRRHRAFFHTNTLAPPDLCYPILLSSIFSSISKVFVDGACISSEPEGHLEHARLLTRGQATQAFDSHYRCHCSTSNIMDGEKLDDMHGEKIEQPAEHTKSTEENNNALPVQVTAYKPGARAPLTKTRFWLVLLRCLPTTCPPALSNY